ncbi:hypothetical protein N9920_02435 [Akkermansiaceae bacterium]|nr:hypothetical protein [Akkermansiaceae bacterium]MDA7519870.1 hypothetical protein [bacterium]MDA7517350.1 hypothetical protein [Akkermansiaceae bacterium]MDA7672626.1 hypothetical protein [Akkermansiaceae bacterium]MDA7863130.1 hypothetical protein [Akkermansiaceae bacterium]
MIDFWHVDQSDEIDKARHEASRAKDSADQAKSDLIGMQRQLDHLTLLCQSMWEVIQEETEITEARFRAKIADVDTRDGKADGKISPQVFACPSCGANCNSARQRCTMCGADISGHKPHLFEA